MPKTGEMLVISFFFDLWGVLQSIAIIKIINISLVLSTFLEKGGINMINILNIPLLDTFWKCA